MKNHKILVIGHFGFENNQLDGQTVKTRTIFEAFKTSSKFEANYFDVSGKKYHIFDLILKLFTSNSIVFLPGRNQLKILSPFLILFRLFFFKKLHYVVVGGWLPNLIESNYYYRYLIRGFNSLSCELASMVKRVKKYHSKVLTLTNFRHDTPVITSSIFDGKEIKCVFFSRVIQEKGIFDAINVVKELKSSGFNIKLDIYGPMGLVDDKRTLFYDSLDKTCQYFNVIDPGEIINTLTGYHILLFPTYYEGEGFPGCIVDAKIAGVTVIASDWKYNNQIIDNGIDGVITGRDYISSAYTIISNFYSCPEELNKLMTFSFSSRTKYFESVAFKNWSDYLFK